MSTDYTLAYGTHATPEEGRCAMEWVSFLAGEPHSDDPDCVSPVLRAYCTTLNDSLDDAPRQLLRPYLTRTIGTRSDGLDGERAWMALDWLIRVHTPAWLAAADVCAAAERLAQLPAVTDSSTLKPALAALRDARGDTKAASIAERGSSRPVALSPRAAGRAAAREAAWSSGAAAAWAAARLAVGDMAADRARAVACELAGDAAAVIARRARPSTERAAAREAAREALAPTLRALERSSIRLLDRMLPNVELQTRWWAPVQSPSEVPV
jgi:hypothetical protein